MQELAGRLTAVDPEASESLKVIAFFDSLVAGGAGAESIVRGTVMIAGTAAGATIGERVVRIGADGARSAATDPAAWPSQVGGDGIRVWIERTGRPHVNDAMILERAALALAIVEARRHPESGAVETLLDPEATADERAAASRRLRLPAGAVRITAVAADGSSAAGVSAVIATPDGLLRALLDAPERGSIEGPAGTATADSAAALPRAWADARTALRLADARHPVVDADDLGILIGLVRTADAATRVHPDVSALRRLDERSLAILDALAEHESIRSAAAALAMHHSSLQSRHASVTRQLGYDPISAQGRLRYAAARMLTRLDGAGAPSPA